MMISTMNMDRISALFLNAGCGQFEEILAMLWAYGIVAEENAQCFQVRASPQVGAFFLFAMSRLVILMEVFVKRAVEQYHEDKKQIISLPLEVYGSDREERRRILFRGHGFADTFTLLLRHVPERQKHEEAPSSSNEFSQEYEDAFTNEPPSRDQDSEVMNEADRYNIDGDEDDEFYDECVDEFHEDLHRPLSPILSASSQQEGEFGVEVDIDEDDVTTVHEQDVWSVDRSERRDDDTNASPVGFQKRYKELGRDDNASYVEYQHGYRDYHRHQQRYHRQQYMEQGEDGIQEA